jgi:murein DD-endopeptidase MepM/ murein hydrolase activator NlpD
LLNWNSAIRLKVFSIVIGLSIAGCVSATPHIGSDGIGVAFPPGFRCQAIGSDFGAWTTMRGTPRGYPHPGVDIQGETVIAPADGEVRIINFHRLYGYQVSLRHTPSDLGIPGTYAITWYSHLKEVDGRNSALKYIREGQRVVVGDMIGEVGRTGELAGPDEHLHWTVYVTKGRWPVDNMGPDMVTPHDWWAGHPLDDPGKIKYIPFVRKGERYEGSRRGFVYPILCP